MFSCVLAGILVFYLVVIFLKWRHCHAGHCEAHTFTYVNLIGDGVHNFIDGMVTAASFTGHPTRGGDHRRRGDARGSPGDRGLRDPS
jgi:zinc and cadmium transporter